MRVDPIDPASVPHAPWSQVGPDFLAEWGYPRGKFTPEHVEILGQNGSGKSWWERQIVLERVRARDSSVVVICTKKADDTIESFGFPVIDYWPPHYSDGTQVIYWRPIRGIGPEALDRQAADVDKLLNQLWEPNSNRIVVFDEIAYVEQELGLRRQLVKYYRESRTLGITIVGTTQRPQGTTRYMHSESAWRAFFAPTDEDDAERMAQVAGGRRTYLPLLKSLNRENFEFLLVHTLNGQMVVSWVDDSAPPFKPRR